MTRRIRGVITPIVTPFTRTYDLDKDALRNVTRFLLKAGVHGIAACGSTGEFGLMSFEERKRVTEIVAEEAMSKVPVVEGGTAVKTEDAVMFAKHAKDLGLDAVLMAPSFYYKIGEKELYSYYGAVAKVDIPIIVYNVPGTTKIDMSPEFLVKLASDFDNIDYVKESTGDISRVSAIERLGGGKIEVICGQDPLIYDFLTHNASGWIATVSNVIPRHCVELFELTTEKNAFKSAKELFYKLLPAINLIDGPRFVEYSKAGLRLIGQDGGWTRNPLLPLDENELEYLKDVLAELEVPHVKG